MFKPEEITRIINLAREGLNQAEIAADLGLPLATLRLRLLNSGYRFVPKTEVVPVRAVELEAPQQPEAVAA